MDFKIEEDQKIIVNTNSTIRCKDEIIEHPHFIRTSKIISNYYKVLASFINLSS